MRKIQALQFKIRQFLAKADPRYMEEKIMNSRRYKSFRRRVRDTIREQIKVYDDERIIEDGRAIKKDLIDPLMELINKHFKPTDYFMDQKFVEDYLLYAATAGGQAALDALGINGVFGLKSLDVIEALSNRFRLLITSVDLTTKNQIADILSNGYADNLTNPQIAQIIRERLPEISQIRSEMIAHAETANAMMQTELVTVEKNGVTKKTWMSSRDAKVSEGCVSNDDGKYYKLDHIWEGGGTAVDAPPRFPRCRCYMNYEVPDYEEFNNEPNYWLGE